MFFFSCGEPGAGEVAPAVVFKVGEEHNVDGDAEAAEVGDDAFGAGVEVGGDDEEVERCVELVECRDAEAFFEGNFEGRLEVIVGQVDDGVAVESGDPGAVVEDLGDHVPWCLVTLEFEHVNTALAVDREQVDELAVGRADLSADHKQALPKQRRVPFKELLEHHLGRHRGGGQAPRVSPSIRQIPISTGIRARSERRGIGGTGREKSLDRPTRLELENDGRWHLVDRLCPADQASPAVGSGSCQANLG